MFNVILLYIPATGESPGLVMLVADWVDEPKLDKLVASPPDKRRRGHNTNYMAKCNKTE